MRAIIFIIKSMQERIKLPWLSTSALLLESSMMHIVQRHGIVMV